MSFITRLLGRQSESGRVSPLGLTADEQAVDRYRYLLRTAPPQSIEQVHEEAFAQLTPTQRRLVLEGLNGDLPAQERGDLDDPRSLARLATRAELRRPGTLERTFGRIDPRGSTAGVGGLLTGNFLNTIAAVVVGTALADAIFDDGGYSDGYQDGVDAGDVELGGSGSDAGYAVGNGSVDTAGDHSVGDFGGGEF